MGGRAQVWIAVVALTACGGKQPAAPLPPLPHTAYAHYLDARLAGYRDDWAAAVDALADALAAAPDQPVVAVELARAQIKAKRPDDAAATLAMARTKWPAHPAVWLASGDVFATTSPERAIEAYKKAIALEPTEERAYLGLARLESRAASLATLRELVAKVPTSIEGRYRLGQRLAFAHDIPGAIAQMRKVLELDPDHIDARLDLSRGLRLTGKLDEAIAQARSAFDRSGQALDLAEELFYLLVEADDHVAVIDLLTLLDDDRSDAEALATVAKLDRSLGRLAEAREIAARIGTLDHDLGELVGAEIDLAAGDPAAAAQRALAIAEGSERFAESRRIAATAWLAAEQPQQALSALAPVRAATPRDVESALLAATALIDLGKRDEARATLAALGDSAAATLARARAADHAGDTRTAIEIAEALIRAKPDLTGALNFAGYLLADRDDRLADAERYLSRARALAPGDPAVLDSWGWLLLKKGEPRAAVRVLDRAVRYAPREAEIHVHLAAAWLADGAPRTAAATLDHAMTLHPSRAVVRRIEALRQAIRDRR